MSNSSGARWISALVLGAAFTTGTSAAAATRCDQLPVRLAHQVTDANCFESTDLTTNNPVTTPADNSLTPPFPAFRLYAADRPFRHLAQPAQPHANHQGSTGRTAGCAHRRRSGGPSPDPDPAAGLVERKARRCRCLQDAQRVQWRLRLE